MTGKDLVFLLFTGKREAYPEGGARINGIDKCATSAPPWASHATQKSPAPAQRYKIKGKEFHQVSVPQPGGGRRLRTFKNPDEAKRFYAAVQGELSPGTEVRSIKRSFPGAALGLEKERKRERSRMAHDAV